MVLSPDLLRVESLTKIYSEGNAPRTAFRNVNFTLGEHDSMTVVGRSGCGKSSLLLVIAGLLTTTSGTIRLEDEVLSGPTRKVALVFQEYGLFPWKTARKNILLGAQMRKINVEKQTFQNLKWELGIHGLDELYPHQLSGGQRQRVALARALLLEPQLLLLDEPYAALDAFTREHLQNHLLSIFNLRKFSFILVTHNVEEAVFLGHRILVMGDKGESVRAMIRNPGAGRLDYREKPEYFEQVMRVRKTMRGIEN